ncbi:MAG: carboxymethylenebutenolidase [Chloroflexota bacterium]|jgi:carboxymethylenebutenolidase|nr:carboxymethylenebutenolidase [Chloroflexota bacterium]
MCFPPGARPPEIPSDLRPISGGAGGEDVLLKSKDGATFRASLTKARQGDAGVVIAPDVRGLHRFYEELAERFASAGVHAIAFDYFGRTAGTGRRSDDFAFQEHVTAARARPDLIQADVAASAAALRSRTGASRIFVLGFCMGGRVAFNASAEQDGLAGVVGFYGVTRRRDEHDTDAPIDKVNRMRAPILGLFGGADGGIPAEDNATFDRALDERTVPHRIVTYPGAPHSFFDRSFADFAKECDDAWRRVLGFMATGDPNAGQ